MEGDKVFNIFKKSKQIKEMQESIDELKKEVKVLKQHLHDHITGNRYTKEELVNKLNTIISNHSDSDIVIELHPYYKQYFLKQGRYFVTPGVFLYPIKEYVFKSEELGVEQEISFHTGKHNVNILLQRKTLQANHKEQRRV